VNFRSKWLVISKFVKNGTEFMIRDDSFDYKNWGIRKYRYTTHMGEMIMNALFRELTLRMQFTAASYHGGMAQITREHHLADFNRTSLISQLAARLLLATR
jgi:hypothetical protein